MDTKENERLVVANSLWTLVDIEKGIPRRLPKSLIEKYPICAPLDEEFGDRKIVLPEGESYKKEDKIIVRREYIDSNMHVNNGKYIEIASAYLGENRSCPDEIRIEYKKQAVLGDEIYIMKNIRTKELEEIYTIAFETGDGEKYCIIEYIYYKKNRK